VAAEVLALPMTVHLRGHQGEKMMMPNLMVERRELVSHSDS